MGSILAAYPAWPGAYPAWPGAYPAWPGAYPAWRAPGMKEASPVGHTRPSVPSVPKPRNTRRAETAIKQLRRSAKPAFRAPSALFTNQ